MAINLRLEPTRVKHLSGALLQGRLLASSANIRLDCKCLLETNTLAYCENPYIMAIKLRLEPTRVKHLSGALLQGRLLASSANIRLDCKCLPMTNTLAQYKNPEIRAIKSFIVQATDCLQQINNKLTPSVVRKQKSFFNNWHKLTSQFLGYQCLGVSCVSEMKSIEKFKYLLYLWHDDSIQDSSWIAAAS